MIAAVRRGAYAAALLAAMASTVLVASPASADPTPPEPGLSNCDNAIQQGGAFEADITVPRTGVDVVIAHPGPTGALYKVTASDALNGVEFSKNVYFAPGYRQPKNVVIGNAYEKGWSQWSIKIEPQGNIASTYGVEIWTGDCDGDFNANVSGRSEVSFAAAAAEADAKRIELENEEDAYCYAYESWNDGGWGPYLYMHWDNLECAHR